MDYHDEKDQPNDYLSYLLRLWLANDGENLAWRISLESTGTRKRKGFSSIKELVVYLEKKMDQKPSSNQDN